MLVGTWVDISTLRLLLLAESSWLLKEEEQDGVPPNCQDGCPDAKLRIQSAEDQKFRIPQNLSATHLRCLVGLCRSGKVFSGGFSQRLSHFGAVAMTDGEGGAALMRKQTDGCKTADSIFFDF